MANVLIFNEFIHEREAKCEASVVYPDGIHSVLLNELQDEFNVKIFTLDNVNEITEEELSKTDVTVWWGHVRHGQVPDEVATAVQQAVLGGMGFIALHSAHHSKPFKLLMGTNCNLSWRENGDSELVWVCKPSHPIAKGIDRFIKIESDETYSEPFTVPEPDETVFIGSFQGGEVIRAGCCWQRENGKIFYFQPGHETYSVYYNKDVIKVIKNAINWATPIYREKIGCPKIKKLSED